jgi:hypothetical protein
MMNDSLRNISNQLAQQLTPDQRMMMTHIIDDFETFLYFRGLLAIRVSNDAKEFTFT